jgi:hypothetical protein
LRANLVKAQQQVVDGNSRAEKEGYSVARAMTFASNAITYDNLVSNIRRTDELLNIAQQRHNERRDDYRAQFNDALQNSIRLDDGTHVFLSKDGTQGITQDGQALDKAQLADAKALSPDFPGALSLEDYARLRMKLGQSVAEAARLEDNKQQLENAKAQAAQIDKGDPKASAAIKQQAEAVAEVKKSAEAVIQGTDPKPVPAAPQVATQVATQATPAVSVTASPDVKVKGAGIQNLLSAAFNPVSDCAANAALGQKDEGVCKPVVNAEAKAGGVLPNMPGTSDLYGDDRLTDMTIKGSFNGHSDGIAATPKPDPAPMPIPDPVVTAALSMSPGMAMGR